MRRRNDVLALMAQARVHLDDLAEHVPARADHAGPRATR